MKKDFGIKGLVILSAVMSLATVLLPIPIVLEIVFLPIAFLIGLISLMRAIKAKDKWLIIFSIATMILPFLAYGMTYVILNLRQQEYLHQLGY